MKPIRLLRLFASPGERPGGDLVLAFLLIAVVALLVIPLPTALLDLLLATNIAFAVLLVLTSLYVTHPLRLSTFPSILLMATLLRLALNVSSTRLILRDADAGRVIEAFGNFVVSGNYIVGAVIFLILTLIQFLVIARGSERVAEVAARFTLDAMPGRQMAIDADLRSGALTLEEAQQRRAALQSESQLFGSMDGAMKFVKGDAIAGILITLVNVVGGLMIGVAQQGMAAGEAASLYTLLTIGDGLVAQIPALLVAMSAGLVVTRVSAQEGESRDLGTEIIRQLGAEPRVFAIASLLLLGFALVPGLPFFPFLLLGGASFTAALALHEREERAARARAQEGEAREASAAPPAPMAGITLELAPDLGEALLQEEGEIALRRELAELRQHYFEESGVRLPGVRTRFGVEGLPPGTCRVRIWDVPERDLALDPERVMLAVDPDEARAAGLPVLEPGPGAPLASDVCWIASGGIALARQQGLPLPGLAGELTLRLLEVLQDRRADFIGLAETQALLDALEPTHGALIEAVVPRPISLTRLAAILRRLADDGVSIRDLRAILEALAAGAREGQDVVAQVELCRCALSRPILHALGGGGAIPAWFVDATIEETIRAAIDRSEEVPRLLLSPSASRAIADAFLEVLPDARHSFCVVASQDVRRYLQQLLRLTYPSVVAVGLGELGERHPIRPLGTIGMGAGAPTGR